MTATKNAARAAASTEAVKQISASPCLTRQCHWCGSQGEPYQGLSGS